MELYVVVTDQEGRRLTDLVAEDFEVFESGQRQRITRFVPEFGKGNHRGRGRQLVFVVDDDHMEPGELAPVKAALRRFFDSSLGPGDEVAVVLASEGTGALGEREPKFRKFCEITVERPDGTKIRVPCPPEPGDEAAGGPAGAGTSSPGESTPRMTCQITVRGHGGLPSIKSVTCPAPAFTSDRRALQEAVDRLQLQVPEPPRASRNYPSILTEYQSLLIRSGDEEALALAVDENRAMEPPTRPEDYPATLYPLLRAKARTIADSADQMTLVTLASLERCVRSLRFLPGRKVVVVFSGGFLRGRAGAWTWGDPVLQPIADAAVRAGAVVYVVNTRRLAASPTLGIGAAEHDVRSRIERQAIEAARDGQNRLAGWTGGLGFPDGDDMGRAFERILEDSGNYYRLEYERRPPAMGEFFRRVVVRVPTRFSRLGIRAATGYTVRFTEPPFDPVE